MYYRPFRFDLRTDPAPDPSWRKHLNDNHSLCLFYDKWTHKSVVFMYTCIYFPLESKITPFPRGDPRRGLDGPNRLLDRAEAGRRGRTAYPLSYLSEGGRNR